MSILYIYPWHNRDVMEMEEARQERAGGGGLFSFADEN